MANARTQQQVEQELLEKAAAIEDMVHNHPGWKYLVEITNGLLEREKEALATQPPDHTYYRKIGFIQMYKYCKEIPQVIKDKNIRNFLLSQGRLLGAKTFLNAPKMFIEGIMKGNEIVRKWFEQSNMQLVDENRAKFHEQSLK